jgi:hypothetical protein
MNQMYVACSYKLLHNVKNNFSKSNFFLSVISLENAVVSNFTHFFHTLQSHWNWKLKVKSVYRIKRNTKAGIVRQYYGCCTQGYQFTVDWRSISYDISEDQRHATERHVLVICQAPIHNWNVYFPQQVQLLKLEVSFRKLIIVKQNIMYSALNIFNCILYHLPDKIDGINRSSLLDVI